MRSKIKVTANSDDLEEHLFAACLLTFGIRSSEGLSLLDSKGPQNFGDMWLKVKVTAGSNDLGKHLLASWLNFLTKRFYRLSNLYRFLPQKVPNSHNMLRSMKSKVKVRAKANDLEKHLSAAWLPIIPKIFISFVFGRPQGTIILWGHQAKSKGHSRFKWLLIAFVCFLTWLFFIKLCKNFTDSYQSMAQVTIEL